MIAICRDPDGFVKMTERVSWCPVPLCIVVPVVGISRGSPPSPKDSVRFRRVRGDDTTWCCFHLIFADRRW